MFIICVICGTSYGQHIPHYIRCDIMSLVVFMLTFGLSFVICLWPARGRLAFIPPKRERVIFIIGMHGKPGYDCTWPVAVLRFGPEERLGFPDTIHVDPVR